MKTHLFLRAFLSIMALASCLVAVAAEPDYYERLLSKIDSDLRGRANDSSLIDRSSRYPIPTNAPISLSALLSRGELCGVRLGMTMSDVVRVWGKPNVLYTRCQIGPRFIYTGPGPSVGQGGVSLFFENNSLALLVVHGRRARDVSFEEGLSGMMGRQEIRETLGPPAEQLPKIRAFPYDGNMVYVERNIRMGLSLTSQRSPEPEGVGDRLAGIAIRFASESMNHTRGEQADEAERK